MRQEKLIRNPFMLMLQPEQVLAAVERSEHLGALKRRLCHPLDRPAPESGGSDPRPRADRRQGADRDD
jgi:hypothetical protein